MTTLQAPPMVMLTITTISMMLGCDPCFLIWLIDNRLACSPYYGLEPDDDSQRLMSLEEAAYVYHIFSCLQKAGESEEEIERYLVSGAPDDTDALNYAAKMVNEYVRCHPEFSLD